MKLNKREVGILEYLTSKEDKTSYQEITSALGIKKSNMANYVKKLVKYGLITIVKENQKKFLILDSSFSMDFLRIRNNIPGLRLSDILEGRAPFLLSFMSFRRKIKLTEVDLPNASAKRILRKLRGLGILTMQKKGIYEIRDDMDPLADFCRDVLMLMYTSESKLELKNMMGIFFSFDSCKELEMICITNSENRPRHYWPTSYSIFHQYGLNLISAGRYYYSNIKPKLEDIIIHTLDFDRDARAIMYVAVLIIKNKLDPNKLFKKRQHFSVPEDFLADFVAFINSEGKVTTPGFPDWKEVQEMI